MSINKVLDLIPHREPMLLVGDLLHVDENSSSSLISITESSSFYYKNKGVPAWIGVEYMGQTAAMIAGHQLQLGKIKPHVGLLLGTRKYQAQQSWFPLNSKLIVSCQQVALVGDNLATFLCEIKDQSSDAVIATAKLSVYRTDETNSEKSG